MVFFLLIAIVGLVLFVWQRRIATQMRANLPQLDGSLLVPGLSAPVTVERDAQGVPHIHASSMNDLVFAQAFVTAQDRLWQMDMLRRHAAGALAAILGPSMLDHDRLQRTLQLRATAERAFAALPTDQKHWLEVYAAGVNASIDAQRDHLPIEFRLIGYLPSPWTPRDCLLVELAMFEDLTTGYPQKLDREAFVAHLPPELVADLYPTGSWRDHPPGQPVPDVTAPQPEVPDVPLDESQSMLRRTAATPSADLLALNRTLAPFQGGCDTCVAGSNGWAVAGSRTESGKPILSSDMHLALAAPGIWYEADLQATLPAPLAEFHVAGVTLPGTPFVIVGHNAHIAWGFTNLGGDVQDLYIEHTRGTPSGAAEYQTASGEWRPVRYQQEVIQVRGGSNVTLSVPLTHHGDVDTPILTSIFPGETRSLSLRWSIYDPANVNDPFFAVNYANDWISMLSAISTWGGPAQNLMYADDQGHIGYHAVGRIPVRGDVNNPSPISPVPTDATAPDAASHEWAGYIPFDQLPQVFDPPDGVLATANARITPDGYRFPITLNWMAPYRTERTYKVLEASRSGAQPTDNGGPATPRKLTPEDMLALQNDVYSALDKVIAQRLAYAIDHATGPLKDDKALHQAADLLRNWNGSVTANASAPAIVNAARSVFWPMVLIPKLAPKAASQVAQGVDFEKLQGLSPDEVRSAVLWKVYTWGERGSVEELMLTHTPARWLPPTYPTWEDFLAAVVQRGLRDAHAPKDLQTWQQGKAYPVDIEHPVFSQSKLLKQLIGVPTGTGPQPKSGDGTTVKQSELKFGPSERFTTDLSDPDRTTLNIVLGQSGDPASPWYMDQFQTWLHGTTYPLPFTSAATESTITHQLTLKPR
ncbi:MAG TPA: penicillin acylase family protein [Acidobacteriaceae bacterium]|jgi:penicillin amidase